MKYNSKTFKEQNYFILYDDNDNVLCYFENFDELKKLFNYRLSDIVYQFNKSDGFINVDIEKKRYKLYTFCDI